jgi:hypothetical protein
VQWNLEFADEVVSLPVENLVWLDADVDINVAVRATGLTDFTLTRELKPQTVFDTTWDVQIQAST